MTPVRPHTTVVLAMSADGKIADQRRSPARFGSAVDKAHLERQIAQADGVLFGAGTLRAYGTTLPVSSPALLQQRQQQGKPTQPVQIVCSVRAQLDPTYRFFSQAVPRWLLTTPEGAQAWANRAASEQAASEQAASEEAAFEQMITVPLTPTGLDMQDALTQLYAAGLRRLVIAGGGELVASLLAIDAIDELRLTVCPLLLGGQNAPTPIEGSGYLSDAAPRLELLSVEAIAHEVFLHYRLHRLED